MKRRNMLLSRIRSFLLAGLLIASAGLACIAAPISANAADTSIADQEIPLAGSGRVLEPQSPGRVTYEGGGVTVDASNIAEGYITVKYSGSASKVKVLVTDKNKTLYQYVVRPGGKYEVIPFTSGDGIYKVEAYYNVSGNDYVQAVAKNIDVRLRNPLLPFLYPNQFVNFSDKSSAVRKSGELSSSAADTLAVVSHVYDYVIMNISYDNNMAQKVQSGQASGYVPDVDAVLASRKGICFDYAALMTAMLRARQIPTRMEFGYVSGGVYHAWISVYLQETGWINGVIRFDGTSWTRMDPTFASGAGPQYVGTGVEYKTVKRY